MYLHTYAWSDHRWFRMHFTTLALTNVLHSLGSKSDSLDDIMLMAMSVTDSAGRFHEVSRWKSRSPGESLQPREELANIPNHYLDPAKQIECGLSPRDRLGCQSVSALRAPDGETLT
jgi:hypothetical protein